MSTADRPPEERSAADRLLDRAPPDAYVEAWRRALQRPLLDDEGDSQVAVGVLRIGGEHLAIDTSLVKEVRPPLPVHVIPGRSRDVFLGLVSVRGQIHLAVSLAALLGIQRDEPDAEESKARLVVVEREGADWAFEVDEVLDFTRVDVRNKRPAQVTVAKSAIHFTDGLLDVRGVTAAYLDGERLWAGFSRSLR